MVFFHRGTNTMPTTKFSHQTYASVQHLAPLIETAEATTKHQPAAFTKEHPAQLHQSIDSTNRHIQRPKQSLNFCPNCNMLLRIIENCPASLRCKKCGYKTKLEKAIAIDKPLHPYSDEIAVIDKEKADLHIHPIVQANCERCGKTESETWTVSVGSEGTVSAWIFLKCVHCGFIRREAG